MAAPSASMNMKCLPRYLRAARGSRQSLSGRRSARRGGGQVGALGWVRRVGKGARFAMFRYCAGHAPRFQDTCGSGGGDALRERRRARPGHH